MSAGGGVGAVVLTDEEHAIRSGEFGDAARIALESQIAVGEFFGADRLVPVSNVHVMGDWEVMGAAGHEFLKLLVEAGGRVAVPTTRNPRPVDFDYAARLRQSMELVRGEQRVSTTLRQLGIVPVHTCTGYQSVYQPRIGEHVAWGDTGAVIYANAVFGARSNFESGPAAVAAAITGRTPAYGFHLDEHRRANVRCRVEARLEDLADWGALGAALGSQVRDYWKVPMIESIEDLPTADALKHLGASLASYGSTALFHLPGATPVAPTAEAAIDGRKIEREIVVTDDDIAGVFATPGAPGEPVDVVVFTAPQLSMFELQHVADTLNGRSVADDDPHPDGKRDDAPGQRGGGLARAHRERGRDRPPRHVLVSDVARVDARGLRLESTRHQLGQAREHHQGARLRRRAAQNRGLRRGGRHREGAAGMISAGKSYNVKQAIGDAVEAPALIDPVAFSARYDLDRDTGRFTRIGHPLRGESIAGKILICPAVQGGVAGGWAFLKLRGLGLGLAGMVFGGVNPVIVQGAQAAAIPIAAGVDAAIFEELASGTWIRLDPSTLRVDVLDVARS
jgi:predicted aconitase/predicted aconitase with swiveling domain